MAKKHLEVGAAPNRGRLLALGAALVTAAWLWLGLTPPALASGVEWQTYLSDDFSGTESMFYTGKAGEAKPANPPAGKPASSLDKPSSTPVKPKPKSKR